MKSTRRQVAPKSSGNDRSGIREVARRAGVSTATVSRVLNGSSAVAHKSREKVQAVLDELQYVRNGAARALSSRRSHTVGVLVPLIGAAVFSEAAEAIQRRLAQAHYHSIIAATGYDLSTEFEAARAMIETGADGLIVVGDRHRPELYELTERTRTPVVQIFVHKPKSKFPSVGFDNFKPAYDLTNRLYDLGHRDFAVMYGHSRDNDRIRDRLDGILKCLKDRKIELPSGRMVEVGHTIADGRMGLNRLLAEGRTFSAVICTGDVIAIGALTEANAQGIAVPDKLSVTGFHDIELALHTNPPLTTVHVPIREMSETAAALLLAKIDGQSTALIRSFQTSIVMRDSAGAISS